MKVKKPPQKPTNLRPYECDLVIDNQHLTKLEISPYYEKHNKEYLEALKKKGIKMAVFVDDKLPSYFADDAEVIKIKEKIIAMPE